jgi:hypothetical protein
LTAEVILSHESFFLPSIEWEFGAKSVRSLKGQPEFHLQWVQIGDLESQLLADGSNDPFATLKWAKKWGSLATGETSDGKWTLKRVGFLHPKVTVRELSSTTETALFSLNWGGDGVLELASEATKFVFKKASMWDSEWILRRSGVEETILSIKPELSLTNTLSRNIMAKVELGQNALSEPRLSLLALVTWHVIILMSYDDSSGGGVTAALMAGIGA